VAWGTKISMTCRYDGPAPSGRYAGHRTTYQLVVLAAGDGGAQSVASWAALPGKDATIAASTSVPADEITGFELRDDEGTVLLSGAPGR
jgi:hypothetical protein